MGSQLFCWNQTDKSTVVNFTGTVLSLALGLISLGLVKAQTGNFGSGISPAERPWVNSPWCWENTRDITLAILASLDLLYDCKKVNQENSYRIKDI